jgi:hypothetical protein
MEKFVKIKIFELELVRLPRGGGVLMVGNYMSEIVERSMMKRNSIPEPDEVASCMEREMAFTSSESPDGEVVGLSVYIAIGARTLVLPYRSASYPTWTAYYSGINGVPIINRYGDYVIELLKDFVRVMSDKCTGMFKSYIKGQRLS